MNNINNTGNINFNARIKFCNKAEFNKIADSIGKSGFVDYPWTLNQTVIGKDAYTKDIHNCTILGITNKLKVLLFHLNPNDNMNWSKSKIKKMIKKHFDLSLEDVQAFVLGSKKNSAGSRFSSEFFDYVKSVPEELKIPYSSFKGGNYTNDVAYTRQFDTWFITNNLTELEAYNMLPPEEKAKFTFNEVKLTDTDKFAI